MSQPRDELMHYGKKGMKWGVRSSSSTSTGSKKGSSDHAEAMSLKKKGAKNLSNADLTTLNKRLQLEVQYKKLTTPEVSAGKKLMQDILKESAKKGIKGAAATGLSLGVAAAKKELVKSMTF